VRQSMMVILVLTVVSVVSADNWCGFRGLEKEGRSDSVAGPLNWSLSHNVAWRTVIPGRGHSSPIVSGNAIYVTTAYERDSSSLIQDVLNYALAAWALLVTTTGISFLIPRLGQRPRRLERTWPHLRFFLFVQLLLAVTIVVLWGRHLLNPDGDTVRLWLV
jgi:hypothetical protein